MDDRFSSPAHRDDSIVIFCSLHQRQPDEKDRPLRIRAYANLALMIFNNGFGDRQSQT